MSTQNFTNLGSSDGSQTRVFNFNISFPMKQNKENGFINK